MGRKTKNFHVSGGAKAYAPGYAAQAQTRQNLRQTFIPVIFQNPYNDNDYDIIEDIHLNTLAGKVIDEKVNMIMGGGIKPVFELREPYDEKGKELDEEAKNIILDKYTKAQNELIKIDERNTINLNEKAKNAIRDMLVFGRSVLAFEPDGLTIPKALKPIHPRDLGRIFVHQLDWSLSSVRAFLRLDLIHAEEMIYFVNMQNSPARRGMWYGFSELQRVIGQSRALRKVQEFDIPEVAETLWAGYGLIRVDNEGLNSDEKKKDLQTIRDGMIVGGFNFINGKKDEIEFMKFDTDPRIAELLQVVDSYERDIIGNSGMPGAVFGREEESNMATLFGKMRWTINGPIRSVREDVSKIIGEQWYEHNLRLIDPETAEAVRVKAEFQPVVMESWQDIIESLNKLKQLVPGLPDSELLKLANLEELVDKIEVDKTPDPLGLKEQQNDMRNTENNDNLKRLVEMQERQQRTR